MPQFREMDQRVTLRDQMAEDVGPVTLINTFTVDPDELGQLLRAWAADAATMKRQPGFISTQLYQGVGASSVLVNVAVWESADAFRRAFGNPEFQAALGAYPPSTVVSPHLFTKVAVPGICVA